MAKFKKKKLLKYKSLKKVYQHKYLVEQFKIAKNSSEHQYYPDRKM